MKDGTMNIKNETAREIEKRAAIQKERDDQKREKNRAQKKRAKNRARGARHTAVQSARSAAGLFVPGAAPNDPPPRQRGSDRTPRARGITVRQMTADELERMS